MRVPRGPRARWRWPLLGLVLATAAAAQEPAHGFALSSLVAPPSEPFDVMHLLAAQGLHELLEERFNVYAQATYISHWKLPFKAPYTNAFTDAQGALVSQGSLLPTAEQSYTFSATLYLGVRLWPGAEAYLVPELITERPFSGLHGLGGAIQNFELQKTGGDVPDVYRSRIYLRQTLGFGGGAAAHESTEMQLGASVDRRRVVVTLGNFSVLDFLDHNTFTGNPRQQFLNMAFMTHAAWDFASDARGYSWGGAVEVYFDDWALRFARMAPPINPNQLPVGLHLDVYYGDSLELEHRHLLFGREGVVRLLGFRNREKMARFDDAIRRFENGDTASQCGALFNYGSANGNAPDLCFSRVPNVKLGIGLNLEQRLTDELGVFVRGMYSDGQTEVQAYTSSDRSLSFGALSQGSLWHRPADLVGLGGAVAWISKEHADYLRLGGIDGFIGDGNIRQAPEGAFELFYSFNLLKAVWLTLDFQEIINPAFNADRGPVTIIGGRLHAEL